MSTGPLPPTTALGAEGISTKEVDYLDEDKPIRGQNYVCLSFLSPEDVLADKSVFFFERFLESFSQELGQMFDNLKAKYPADAELLGGVQNTHSHLFQPGHMQENYKYYVRSQGEVLDAAFRVEHPFRTSVRGIKVRGTYDTLDEAKIRAQVLKRMGDKFDIFVAQVGCWCPWSPNPEDLGNVEYAESQLNRLMVEYQKNMTIKDSVFEQRKADAVEAAAKRVQEKKAAEAPEAAAAPAPDALMAADPWLERKGADGASSSQ